MTFRLRSTITTAVFALAAMPAHRRQFAFVSTQILKIVAPFFAANGRRLGSRLNQNYCIVDRHNSQLQGLQ